MNSRPERDKRPSEARWAGIARLTQDFVGSGLLSPDGDLDRVEAYAKIGGKTLLGSGDAKRTHIIAGGHVRVAAVLSAAWDDSGMLLRQVQEKGKPWKGAGPG